MLSAANARGEVLSCYGQFSYQTQNAVVDSFYVRHRTLLAVGGRATVDTRPPQDSVELFQPVYQTQNTVGLDCDS